MCLGSLWDVFLPTLWGVIHKTFYDKLTIIFKVGVLHHHKIPVLILNSAVIGHIYVNSVLKEFIRWFVNPPPGIGWDKTSYNKLTIIFKAGVPFLLNLPFLTLNTFVIYSKMSLESSKNALCSNNVRCHSQNLLR